MTQNHFLWPKMAPEIDFSTQINPRPNKENFWANSKIDHFLGVNLESAKIAILSRP